jgi:hypothetical protein
MGYAFRSASTTPPGNNNAVPVTAVGAGTTAGDLLLAVLSVATGGSGGSQPTITAPSGWLQLGSTLTNQSSTTGVVFAVFYRWSNGSDPTVSFTLDPSVLFKYALQIYGYSGGPGSGVPTVVITASPTGTAGNSVSGTGTANAQPYAEAFSEKTTTNTSYGTISGLTTRSSGMFGSGGGAVDLLFADHLTPVTGTVGGDTAVPGTSGSRGANVLILFPAGGAASVAATVGLTAAGVVGTQAGAAATVSVATTVTGFKHSSTGATVSPTVGLTASGVVLAGIGSPAAAAVAVSAISTGLVGAKVGSTSSLTVTITAAGTVTVTLLFPHGRTQANVVSSVSVMSIDCGDSSIIGGSFVVGGFSSSTMVAGYDGGDAFDVGGPSLDGGGAADVITSGYDGGFSDSTMLPGIDGNSVDATVSHTTSGRTFAAPRLSGRSKTLVLKHGSTAAHAVRSGKTVALSQ